MPIHRYPDTTDKTIRETMEILRRDKDYGPVYQETFMIQRGSSKKLRQYTLSLHPHHTEGVEAWWNLIITPFPSKAILGVEVAEDELQGVLTVRDYVSGWWVCSEEEAEEYVNRILIAVTKAFPRELEGVDARKYFR